MRDLSAADNRPSVRRLRASVVEKIQRRFAEGATCRTIASELHVSKDTANAYRPKGHEHIRCFLEESIGVTATRKRAKQLLAAFCPVEEFVC